MRNLLGLPIDIDSVNQSQGAPKFLIYLIDKNLNQLNKKYNFLFVFLKLQNHSYFFVIFLEVMEWKQAW